MTKIHCDKKNCIYAGRKSGRYRKQNGEPVYCCTKENILITDIWDMDKEIETVSGELAICACFKAKEKE